MEDCVVYFVEFFSLSNHIDPTVDPKHTVMTPSRGGLPVQEYCAGEWYINVNMSRITKNTRSVWRIPSRPGEPSSKGLGQESTRLRGEIPHTCSPESLFTRLYAKHKIYQIYNFSRGHGLGQSSDANARHEKSFPL